MTSTKFNKTLTAISLSTVFLISGNAIAGGHVYSGFPITEKSYTGDKKTSVSYTGQIARHVLHDSLKKLAVSGDGKENADLKKKMLSYYNEKDSGRAILAPKTKGPFLVKQSYVDDISKGKNLAGKTYKGIITGMPNGMTGIELVNFWIDKASSANKGVDTVNGYNYGQLISKFIMGAVSYNQAVDNYLDEKLSAANKPNDKPYKKGAAYTGKEHSWDEAFGYFGAPAHTLTLSPKNVYEIAKQGSKSKKPEDAMGYADYNKDGNVDLKTEFTFGPAYYASSFDSKVYDQGKSTTYLHTITKAFLDGRKLITNAQGKKLNDSQRNILLGHAAVIEKNWQQVLAEATFKYAGSSYKDMAALKTIIDSKGDTSKALGKYIKHWGELKGFSLALQTGKSDLGETAKRVNRLIGFGPLMPNLSQVSDVDSKGNYVRDQGETWGGYMMHMLKLQKLLIAEFGIKARNNDMTGDMATLTKSLGDGASSEND
jgi:hypothetical protein